MNFYTFHGSKRKLKNPTKYLIDWEGKSRSKFQKKVKDLLYPFWSVDVVFEELPVLGTRMTLDFYNANRKIAVEVDGQQHYKYNKHFHGGNRQNFLNQISRDHDKELFCERNSIALIRILPQDQLSESFLQELEII